VSQSTTTFPTDLWVPSTAYVKPQRGLQASLGYFHNFKDNTYETSVEVYYKKLWNQIEYGEEAIKSDGTDRDTEDQFVFGTGQSYGAEFFVKKKYGKFNGWIGYTLAWTERDFPTLNKGEKFWAKYDRRHDLSVVLIYDITKRIKLSATFVYSSGQNTTIAVRRYFINGELRADYGKRNGYRLPAYHRLDVGFTYVLKDNEKRYSDLNISIYNLYSRKNPYFFYDDINSEVKTDANGNVIGSTFEVQTKQVSLFPILPTLSWNFKF
ncbi:MAG: TonB-dependent receptor, partial [Chitinophagales bacterium]|nr:TonB-dependent receptor [Chitinophagales bacterium]